MEDHQIAAVDRSYAQLVFVFVDEDALFVGQAGHHAGALHLHGLVDEDDQDYCQHHGNRHVAQQRQRRESRCGILRFLDRLKGCTINSGTGEVGSVRTVMVAAALVNVTW